MYINSQQIYNFIGLYAHKFYISNNLNAAISEYKGLSHCEGHDYEEFPDDFMEERLSDLIFTRTMKMLSRLDGFMLYCKLGVDFFSTELLYANTEIRLRLIRARPIFYTISDNPNVGLGIVDYSLHTRRFSHTDDYHKKRMNMLAYPPVEFNYLETLAKIFIIPAR